MSTRTYTLSSPASARTLHLIDGTTAKLVTLSYFCWSSEHDPRNPDYYGNAEGPKYMRLSSQCRANVLKRKREAWRSVHLASVYVAFNRAGRSSKPEEGAEVYLWRHDASRTEYGLTYFDFNPTWFDINPMRGKLVGTLRKEFRKWVLMPNEPAMVVLARQALG